MQVDRGNTSGTDIFGMNFALIKSRENKNANSARHKYAKTNR